MNIFFGIIVVPLVIMAIFLLNGKGAFLIAGYNTSSEKEKSKYDEKALCRFVGWLLLGISFGMMIIPIGIYLDIAWLPNFAIFIIIFGSIGAVIYANTGGRFYKNTELDLSIADENASSKAATYKAKIIVIIVISVLSLIALGILFYQGGKDPVINILDESIQIKAMYGLSIDFIDITDISLIDKSMSEIGVGRRINGYGGNGEALKGNFKSDNLGETLLFVQSKSTPTIRIERDGGKPVYISFRNGETTETLYHEMMSTISVK
ncbi:DUF3784 domain-containing protein [Sedimentibacter hydroxybenzoicus DSM 7310]|uniref:DUF3784 domain-containing protein n=1 Tax=Sedimentibacter hydroxybenzoicus DSM 7310 TaxID=1123245 RepID=A0A974BMA0_SEDHY|nr:DUF3784 domain-containing protein [Sedimentibacter hydroxybenzoicus]NYB75302.1 DUF3784 domain-containing protein [Sedimentibacter hydroxybenzoicus DSM 7310]